MNSLLYMTNYMCQLQDPDSVNHVTSEFPSGTFLSARPFMYVNIFWTVMPICVITQLLRAPGVWGILGVEILNDNSCDGEQYWAPKSYP